MALAGTTIWEVETGGDDTNNGGAFDPGQTAGMFSDGAATVANTASPVFTSASYNFVAGDVGAWVFIGAGTNWTKGWYKIASVGSNAATLSAAIGAAVQSSGATTSPIIPSTVIGCATTASPTSQARVFRSLHRAFEGSPRDSSAGMSSVYTEAQLLANIASLETAMARGERMVQLADRSVTYRSADELRNAISYFAELLNQLRSRPKQSLGVARKGF